MEDARIDILKAALAESRCIPKAERDAICFDLLRRVSRHTRRNA